MFKSFKENFCNACHQLCKGGRVVTDQDITDLVAEAWPVSVTPVILMNGFKRCGIYLLNPSEVEDRMLKIAPSQSIACSKCQSAVTARVILSI